MTALIKYFVPSILLLVLSYKSNGQKTVEPIKGYKNILEIRFSPDNKWKANSEQNICSLVDVVLKLKKGYNQIIPIQYAQGKDTLIYFYYSEDLKKIHKKNPIKFTITSKLSKQPFATLSKKAYKPAFVYDSIYQVMKSNMLINSELFNLDKYLDSKETNATCCSPKTQDERLYLIYTFFKNGILLGEDTYSGRLYYKPY